MPAAPKAVLLINMGSPDSPSVPDVRRYLREFLSDGRVLDIPAPLRWLLLHAVILPFRPRTSAHAYGQIWTEQGSPLLVHSQSLAGEIQKVLPDHPVFLAMRYGKPGMEEAVDAMFKIGIRDVVAVPLYPQYATSSTGTAVAAFNEVLSRRWNALSVQWVSPFHGNPGFVQSQASSIRAALNSGTFDRLILSYHGLPERHIHKSDSTSSTCLASSSCCQTAGPHRTFCYKAQCHATSEALLGELNWPSEKSTTCFQSRLGRQKWIGPATDQTLLQSGRAGESVLVACPSFVVDCLETLEEIGIRGRKQFMDAGGKRFELVPCLNSSAEWVKALAEMVRQELQQKRPGPSDFSSALGRMFVSVLSV